MSNHDKAWRLVPDDTWVAVHRATGAHAGMDPRYSYHAEVGYKGDWRTGEVSGESPEVALMSAAVLARQMCNLPPDVPEIQEEKHTVVGQLWMDVCRKLGAALRADDEYRWRFLFDLMERLELEYPKQIAVEKARWTKPEDETPGKDRKYLPIVVQVPESGASPGYQIEWDWEQSKWIRRD